MKFKFFAFILFTFSLLFFSCQKAKNNTLVVHILGEPDDLHPVNGASATRAEINLYTHLSLLRLNYKTGELLPCLAKNLPQISENGLNYTYELNDNMFWDDKTPITAKDVLFTVKASKCLFTNNTALKPYWENIAEIKLDSINNLRFTVIMKRPYILNTWFWTDFPIIQETFYDKVNVLSKYTELQLTDSSFLSTHNDIKNWSDEFNSSKYYTNPNDITGAGPYKISKWEKGISIILEKKKNHWTENFNEEWYCKAYPDKIIYKINQNNTSAILELKSGLIDISGMIDYLSFSELEKDKKFSQKFNLVLAETYNYTYVAMNMMPDGIQHKKLFNDVNVRKAMAMLTPYEQINKTIYGNKNTRVAGPITPNKKDINELLIPIKYDVKEAEKILQDNGWKDTDSDGILDKIIEGKKTKFEFSINYMSGSKAWEDIAKQIAESMSKVGIFVMLNPLDYNSFFTAATTHDFDMVLSAWQSSAAPDDFSQIWHSNSWKNNGLNFTGYGTKESDALIDSINTCVNETKRIALSKRFQKNVYDNAPYIFLFAQKRRIISNKKWENLAVYNEYPGVLLNTLKLKE